MKKIKSYLYWLITKLVIAIVVSISAYGVGMYINTLSRQAWEYARDIHSLFCFLWLWMAITYVLFGIKKKA